MPSPLVIPCGVNPSFTYTRYPCDFDDPRPGDTRGLPVIVDLQTPVKAEVVNRQRESVLAIEGELGIKPSGTYTTVRARLDALEQILQEIEQALAGLGVFVANGDLKGSSTNQTVVGLNNIPIDVTVTPTDGQALVYSASTNTWAPGTVSGGVSFSITGFGCSAASLQEVGATISSPVTFTASYSQTPSSSSVTDGTNTLSMSPPNFTSGSLPHSYTKSTYGGNVTFTLSAVKGTQNPSSSISITWCQKVYWGNAPLPGTYNQAFIQGLSGHQLQTSRGITFTATAGLTDHVFYCFRSAYGTPTFMVGGFAGGFSLLATVSVTNANGFTENYDVWGSDYPNLATITVVVS